MSESRMLPILYFTISSLGAQMPKLFKPGKGNRSGRQKTWPGAFEVWEVTPKNKGVKE